MIQLRFPKKNPSAGNTEYVRRTRRGWIRNAAAGALAGVGIGYLMKHGK